MTSGLDWDRLPGKKRFRSDNGSILVEFALLLLPLVLILACMVDYALCIEKAVQLQDAAVTAAVYCAY